MKLEQILIITPEDNQTNIPIRFILEQDYQALEITFSYGPAYATDEEVLPYLMKTLPRYLKKEVTPEVARRFLPVENLVTLSLAYEGDYLGARHTKERVQRIVLSPSEASLGFPAMPIEKGEWELQLNVHNNCSPKLTANITIEAKGAVYETIRS